MNTATDIQTDKATARCLQRFVRGQTTATLINGDCLQALREVGNVDAVVTDPPYGNGDSGRYGRSQLGHRTIIGDDNLEWLKPAAEAIYATLKQNGHCIAFCQWRTFANFREEFQSAGFQTKSLGVWDKCNAGLGAGVAEQWEGICFFRKGEIVERKFRGNVFTYPRLSGRPEHPNQKPENLMGALIELVSAEGDTILDPFMGSGSTGVAALKGNRNFIGIEKDEQHFRTACKRIAAEMGQGTLL